MQPGLSFPWIDWTRLTQDKLARLCIVAQIQPINCVLVGNGLRDQLSGVSGVDATNDEVGGLQRVPLPVKESDVRVPCQSPKHIDTAVQDISFVESSLALAEWLPDAIGATDSIPVHQRDIESSRMTER